MNFLEGDKHGRKWRMFRFGGWILAAEASADMTTTEKAAPSVARDICQAAVVGVFLLGCDANLAMGTAHQIAYNAFAEVVDKFLRQEVRLTPTPA